jgi:hypothetical protein
MHATDELTTERLRKKFKNNFDLCNLAIQIGRSRVLGGETNVTLAEILEIVEETAEETEQ